MAVNWTNKKAVISFAQKIDSTSVIPQVVYKRSDRPDYIITNKTRFEIERAQCYAYGIDIELVWEGVGR